MADPIAAAVAFTALGANVLATGLLALLNPRSRSVRWYVPFLVAVSMWLLSRGVLSIRGDSRGFWPLLFEVAVMMMPVLFLAGALVEDPRRGRRAPWLVTAAGLAMLPVGVAALRDGLPGGAALVMAWQAAGWGAGSWLHWRAEPRRTPADPRYRRAYRWVLGLALAGPFAVVVGFLAGAEAFFTYAMPLVVVGIHFLVFVGVVRLRFYDIEVRAARSGEIATRAGEVERLAAVGELAASVAHEVRNPLTGLRSLAQRMTEGPIDAERWRRYASVMVVEVDRVDRIVGSLLSLARRGRLGPWAGAPTELDPLFDDLALLTAARARQGDVVVRIERAGTVAPAPRDALAQALLNLLLNALAHTPRGGTVTLGAVPGPHVILYVRDTGPGVPVADRERIFEPFHSADVDGAGLGLSVVRHVAREMDWRVEVADAPGGGAEFRIRLPATPRARTRAEVGADEGIAGGRTEVRTP